MEEAAFSLESYRFTRASFNFDIPAKAHLKVDFNPRGEYSAQEGTYELCFDVTIKCEETHTNVIQITCVANFRFNMPLKLEEIPTFFYPNSLAILFPYVRAFVSTLSLQANVRPVMLPTINLMGLTDRLRAQTILI